MIEACKYFDLVKSQTSKRLTDKAGNTILEIIFPDEYRARARKVVSRSRARSTGKYPSWKMGRMIQWESLNELNAYRLLDATPAVLAYHEQPFAIRFLLNGEPNLHYPDTFVQWENARELWEIKPEKEAAKPEILVRTKFLESVLSNLGFIYRMVIGEDLACEPRLTNALTFLKFGRAPVEPDTRERIRRLFERVPVISWGFVVNGEIGLNGKETVSRLVLEGVLYCDMEQPVAAHTQFVWAVPASPRGG